METLVFIMKLVLRQAQVAHKWRTTSFFQTLKHLEFRWILRREVKAIVLLKERLPSMHKVLESILATHTLGVVP